MRRSMSVRERRLASLIALMLLIWTLGSVVQAWILAPFLSLIEESASLEQQHQHYARAISQAPALIASLEQARKNPINQKSLLSAPDPGSAAAELMQLAVDRVNAQASNGPGCSVSQRMPIIPEQEKGLAYRQVKVSLTLDCGTEPLTRFFQALEYGQPAIFIESLSINRPSSSPSEGPGKLRVQVLLRSYLSGAASEEVTLE